MEAGQRVRDFLLEEKIGAGGVGEVWRARHLHLDNTVAIKAIYRHLSHDRFLQEAVAMAKLDHPHIVSVHDFFFVDDDAYLVMAYIDGGPLADLLKQRGHLPLAEALHISQGILAALNFAHSRGVIHRDVKPSNILVRPDGHAYLSDFGIALVLGKPRMTRYGTNVGTPEYMSPEQITAKELDHRTDVYSFGCVLYEMLTGRPPFGSQDTGQAEYDTMNGHLQERPPALRDLNPAVDERVEAIVLHALAKAPNDRYSGCQEMAEALLALEAAAGSSDDRLPHLFHRLKRTRQYLVAAVAVILVSTALAVVGWLRPGSEAASQRQLVEALEQKNSQLTAENTQINQNLDRLGQLLRSKEKELEDERKNPNVSNKLSEVRQDNERLRKENSELRAKYATWQTDYRDVVNQRNEARQDNERLRKERSAFTADQPGKTRQDNELLRKENMELKNSITRLDQLLQKQEKELDRLRYQSR